MTDSNRALVAEQVRINTDETEYGRRSRGHTRHGHTLNGIYSPTYSSWQAMLARCRYAHRDPEAKYAQRGISVADRWLSFEAFLEDMGERPEGTTLDRIRNDEGYAPGNCRWATPVEQARNRRNARLTYEDAFAICCRVLAGEQAAALAREYGCSESLPREIVKGRSWKDASAAAHKHMEKRRG